jgi:hypothetical protein
MNERIKELAGEARIKFSAHWAHRGVDTAVITMLDLKEFAELIVKDITVGQRELAKILSDTGSEDQAYILRITASNIERKFGVEE